MVVITIILFKPLQMSLSFSNSKCHSHFVLQPIAKHRLLPEGLYIIGILKATVIFKENKTENVTVTFTKMLIIYNMTLLVASVQRANKATNVLAG